MDVDKVENEKWENEIESFTKEYKEINSIR